MSEESRTNKFNDHLTTFRDAKVWINPGGVLCISDRNVDDETIRIEFSGDDLKALEGLLSVAMLLSNNGP